MWKLFSKKKPKKAAWYMCTVEVPGTQRYVMELYYYPNSQKFIDNRRVNVYETHAIYNDDNKRIYTDDLCDRTSDVIAWRKTPKTYMKGFVKDNII